MEGTISEREVSDRKIKKHLARTELYYVLSSVSSYFGILNRNNQTRFVL